MKLKTTTFIAIFFLLGYSAYSQPNVYPETGTPTFYDYSPGLILQRNTNIGGFTQGIQTRLADGSNHWFFGVLHSMFTVSKGDYSNPLFTVSDKGSVGIGTTDPISKLDVRGRLSVPEIAFTLNGEDNTDPYRLRKVQSSLDVSWLELQLNDNVDESFRIYGNSCQDYACGEYSGHLYHSFDASGNAYHRGSVGIGTTSAFPPLHIKSISPTVNFEKTGILNWTMGNITGNDFYIKADNAPSEPFLIQSGTGNVGIGTAAIDNAQGWHKVLQLHGNHHAKLIVTQAEGVKVGMFAHTGNLAKIGTESQHDLTFTAGYWNDVMTLKTNGNVGVGTTAPDEKLTVNGKIHAKEIKVDLNVPAPDYVFETDYELPKLKDIQSYIAKHKHLPEVPSAKEMEKNGINLSNMNMLLLKKIEELTLHLIEKERDIKILQEEKIKDSARFDELFKRMSSLEKKNK